MAGIRKLNGQIAVGSEAAQGIKLLVIYVGTEGIDVIAIVGPDHIEMSQPIGGQARVGLVRPVDIVIQKEVVARWLTGGIK